MSRFLILVYGICSYIVGLGGLIFFILFIGGWDFLPIHIDSGTPGPLGIALLINVGLVLLFGLQHSVMARPGFKAIWTQVIPKAAERSTYVLLSGVILCLISLYWQALPGTLWHIDYPILRTAITVVQLLGWTLLVMASFVINHFELFGLQQVYFNFVNQPEPTPTFTDRFLYKLVRHPIQLGVLIGIWFAPTMTLTHLMLSTTMSVYIFIGLYYEERDLMATLGQEYKDYMGQVSRLLPLPTRSPSAK
ncbi:NnrU family protein [Acaryochloris sp. IP29b_bin.137]|uniref:methyltransferase family protein n=1 Tax=Acaryochloris sp. IP29b_bin.137 TaxID=2969217 RepID=UPI002636547A|nr:NnrU family protein [Acaryochloris sp. IP29b_bin.137]